jgi:hypothetical protein
MIWLGLGLGLGLGLRINIIKPELHIRILHLGPIFKFAVLNFVRCCYSYVKLEYC